jgi:hypothetical protein
MMACVSAALSSVRTWHHTGDTSRSCRHRIPSARRFANPAAAHRHVECCCVRTRTPAARPAGALHGRSTPARSLRLRRCIEARAACDDDHPGPQSRTYSSSVPMCKHVVIHLRFQEELFGFHKNSACSNRTCSTRPWLAWRSSQTSRGDAEPHADLLMFSAEMNGVHSRNTVRCCGPCGTFVLYARAAPMMAQGCRFTEVVDNSTCHSAPVWDRFSAT